ncbi:MAG: ABC transporter ATP-binding protein [Propionibacteriaceae bacterium]|nr:ABC transporter ATP-binding protein [Propionibacteriaceae bacterium]
MIVVDCLVKSYRHVVAVKSLSLSVADGVLYAFLGPNGAGKTTAISCMTTLLSPDSGTITVDGYQVGKEDHLIRQRIGIVFQESLLDPFLTVRENLDLRRAIYGGPKSRIDELIELVDLRQVANRKYGVLSGGERRRADIARALYHQPGTLFLDEPTTGLDPGSRAQVWSAITGLRESLGLTVLLTTHYMQETEAADHVLVINHGEKLAEGTPMALRAQYSMPRISFTYDNYSWDMILEVMGRYLDPTEPWIEGGAIHAYVPNSDVARQIIYDLDLCPGDFQFVQGTMDDVFLNLTTGDPADGGVR